MWWRPQGILVTRKWVQILGLYLVAELCQANNLSEMQFLPFLNGNNKIPLFKVTVRV